MDHSQVFWEPGNTAPAVARFDPQVFWVRSGGREFVRLLDRPVGVVLHWISTPHLKPKGRSMPCTGKLCRYCHDGSRREVKAYGPALHWKRDLMAHETKGGKGGTWDRCVVEIPGEPWEDLQAQVLAVTPHGTDPQWRGAVLEMSRPGGAGNSRVFVTLLERQLTDPLPEAFDVRPILMRVWGLRDRLVMPPASADTDAAIIPFRKKGGA